MGPGLSPRDHVDAILKMKPALDGVSRLDIRAARCAIRKV
jgi:hypothetical protein